MGYDVSKLEVHGKSKELFRLCYTRYSTSTQFWLRDQILKSASSIGANIAEMSGYESSDMKIHKCSIALGEAAELMFWLTTIDEISDSQIIQKINDVQKMLYSLRKYYSSAKSQEASGKRQD
jgi:four helix bundle protein